MKKRIAFAFAVLTMCACIHQEKGIIFEKIETVKPFTDMISSIDLIPLETDSLHYLGIKPELALSGKNYILTDNNRILRYSPDGKFLNEIGRGGRAENEYEEIQGIQATENDIIVFSRPGKMLRFKPDGKFDSSENHSGLGFKSHLVKEGILTYYSYGSGHPYRAALISNKDTMKFLQTSDKVMSLDMGLQTFSDTRNGAVTMIDSYNPDIYKYKNGELKPYLNFNFGEYAIPKSFFKGNDPYESAESLFSKKSTLIFRYFENDKYKFVEIHIQDSENANLYCGIEKGGIWHWFFPGKQGEEPLSDSFRLFDREGDLICIMEPDLIGKIPASFKKLIKNQEVLGSIGENSNCIIAKIKLK